MYNNDAKEIKFDISGQLTQEEQEFTRKLSSLSGHLISSKGDNEAAEFKFDISEEDLKQVFNLKEEEINKLNDLINNFNTHEERKNISALTSKCMQINGNGNSCAARIEYYDIFNPCGFFYGLSTARNGCEVAMAFCNAARIYQSIYGCNSIEYRFLSYLSMLPVCRLNEVVCVIQSACYCRRAIYVSVTFYDPCSFHCILW